MEGMGNDESKRSRHCARLDTLQILQLSPPVLYR